MRRAAVLLLFLSLSPSLHGLEPEHPARLVGRLAEDPVPDLRGGVQIELSAAPEALLDKLPSRPGAGDRVFSASLRVLPAMAMQTQLALVEPAQGEPFVYVDLDLDGTFAPEERFSFDPMAGVDEGEAVVLRFPVNTGGFRFYPVLFRLLPWSHAANPDGPSKRLVRSILAYLEGTVRVGLREVRVRYPLGRTGAVGLRGSRLGMDLDGDGVIEEGLSDGEAQTAYDGPAIFRLGDLYLSTQSLDFRNRRMVLRTHPASEHMLFDLRPGEELANFSFTDLEGRQRWLSELRGKVVLIDFWGTWCGPCLHDLPNFRKAYATYRDQGFEILAMDFADDLPTLKAFVETYDLPWINATAESVKEVIQKNFRVYAFPTKILLDREGRILSVGDPGQPSLKKEDFLQTVAGVFDRQKEKTAELVGRLAEDPVPDLTGRGQIGLSAAPEALLDKLPSRPGAGDRVFSGSLWIVYDNPAEAQVALVEPSEGEPFVYADLDMDGSFAPEERFSFEPMAGVADGKAVVLRFPLNTGGFRFYPILLRVLPASDAAPGEPSWRLIRSYIAYLEGTVRIGLREVRVRYSLGQAGAVMPLGRLGMDLDGDGVIADGLSAGEMQASFDEQPIFRLGDLYLSTRILDVRNRRVVLRTHPDESRYTRFDLRPGAELPNFSFTDLEGRRRWLGELRGKVVLIDFWGTWCGPCVADMPTLRKAHATWRDQGFEIVGLNFEDSLAAQKSFVETYDLPWINATAESVRELIRKSFGVYSFPTKILIDREGRIVSVGDPGQPSLKKDALLQTVAEVFDR